MKIFRIHQKSDTDEGQAKGTHQNYIVASAQRDIALDQVDGFEAVAGDLHEVAVPFKHFGCNLLIDTVVFGEQNAVDNVGHGLIRLNDIRLQCCYYCCCELRLGAGERDCRADTVFDTPFH